MKIRVFTFLTHGSNIEVVFPAGLAPYAALSALEKAHGTALIKAQHQLVNCLDAASRKFR